MSGSWVPGRRPITVAVLAMGGEGGGVLTDWIVAVARSAGYVAQSTSVAGVAQRTGATVYYAELLPPEVTAPEHSVRSAPVLSLFPTPGEVDVVIASELMEAGRAVQRGFATPDRTTLIASTNRVFSISEKIAPGDGRADAEALLVTARSAAKVFVGADFMRLATEAGSVVSASLFGALAGSGALPFAREEFEAALRASGKGVEASLRAFEAGHEQALAAREPARPEPVALTLLPSRPRDPEEVAAEVAAEQHAALALSDPASLVGPALQGQAARVVGFEPAARSMLLRGVVRTAVYQSPAYADLYLDRVARLAAVDTTSDQRLTAAAARHVALWMTYQDTIHVALQKIRRRRLDGVRAEARAEPGQLMQVREYLHPQLDEVVDTLPTRLGRRLARSPLFARVVARLTGSGLVVNTTSALGFAMLWMMAMCRPVRPRSLRYGREQQAVEAWLDLAADLARDDADLATEVLECQGLLKGYGATHAHGSESFAAVVGEARGLLGRPDAAGDLAGLRRAALADADGAALNTALERLVSVP